MKFQDLKFQAMEELYGDNAVQSIVEFEGSGYSLSIVKHDFSYGGKSGLYEVAIFKNGDLSELPPLIEEDNVKGWLTEESVEEHINICLLYTSPSPRDVEESRMPSSA